MRSHHRILSEFVHGEAKTSKHPKQSLPGQNIKMMKKYFYFITPGISTLATLFMSQ